MMRSIRLVFPAPHTRTRNHLVVNPLFYQRYPHSPVSSRVRRNILERLKDALSERFAALSLQFLINCGPQRHQM